MLSTMPISFADVLDIAASGVSARDNTDPSYARPLPTTDVQCRFSGHRLGLLTIASCELRQVMALFVVVAFESASDGEQTARFKLEPDVLTKPPGNRIGIFHEPACR